MTDVRHCTTRQNKELEVMLKDVEYADAVAWSALLRSRRFPRVPLLPGCKTLVMELFCGAMLLTLMAALTGYPVSQPTDILLDGSNLLDPAKRREITAQVE